jgi:hypothetical protein
MREPEYGANGHVGGRTAAALNQCAPVHFAPARRFAPVEGERNADLAEVNVIEHRFKTAMMDDVGVEYSDFGYAYFDDPATVTGFAGYQKDGNAAEGRRSFWAEADHIASIPGVSSVLDVGCAKGFLVAELRERDLDAYGIDISRYAVSCAPKSLAPYLRVMSVNSCPSPNPTIWSTSAACSPIWR